MSRYVNLLKPRSPVQQVFAHLEEFLATQGFAKTQYQNETVYKKGIGLLTAPQFVKLEIHGDQIQLQAWLKFALLPGIYLGEMGVTGFFAWLPKKRLKDRVDAIEDFIRQDMGGTTAATQA